ncbi:hypothetical protein [Sulfobacillus sp. hq2]|uniref:TIGR04086 family membrane protein n=1 Tax=Sulfobacillus thermotolerans TaxID=338644 RepID=A0ABM6RRV4_9FIRM|nr:hypothetical protein [Sulfobacillus sp. hq2]AUW94191.1 hypothetical protein BXT84_09725 [Sulfobacillus thermotolerans]MCY0907574.1 hypothetical protein [Sulfobacillus thermotolerans]POB09541.1 hypothetical protein CO251_15060 [Sulfobacillus sp. hq2]
MAQQSVALRGIKITQMILRLAFLVALIIGLGGMFGWFALNRATVDLHIVSGIIVLGAMITVASSIGKARKPGAGALWTGAVLVAVGGLMGLTLHIRGNALGIVHLLLMLVAMGLAEMGASRAKKAA